MARHDLAEFLNEVNLAIENDYSQILSRVQEDPGTAGDQVEETWAQVLRHILPSTFHVVTKGRILGVEGEASGQIDVIVLWPSYPPYLLNKKLYLASGVAAAFECKLTLRKSHLEKLFKNAVKLSRISEKESENRKNRVKRRGGNFAYEEYHRIFEYGLLAHSHASSADEIDSEIRRLDLETVSHPREMVDLVCVHDLGSWVSEKEAITELFIPNGKAPMGVKTEFVPHPMTNYHLLTAEKWGVGTPLRDNFSPLGSFIARLYRKLARVDASLDPLSRYFVSALSTGSGGGKNARFWQELETPREVVEHYIGASEGQRWDEFRFLGF